MANDGIVQIHGKDYMTVARRLELAHESKKLNSIETEILLHDPVVIRAKVNMGGIIFTGISSVNLNSVKQIEKANPYEVAETSAVGRALGFAGIGLIESVASADEVMNTNAVEDTRRPVYSNGQCMKCFAPDGKPHTKTCPIGKAA